MNTYINKIKKAVIGGLLLGSLAIAGNANAGSLEQRLVNNNTTTDIKSGGSITKYTSWFNRTQTTYDLATSQAGLFTLTNVGTQGLPVDPIVQIQGGTPSFRDIRAGLSKYTQAGPVGIYVEATRALNDPNTEAVIDATYKPHKVLHMQPILNAELFDHQEDNGNYALSAKIRAGMEKDGKTIGAILTYNQRTGTKAEYHIGAYVKLTF